MRRGNISSTAAEMRGKQHQQITKMSSQEDVLLELRSQDVKLWSSFRLLYFCFVLTSVWQPPSIIAGGKAPTNMKKNKTQVKKTFLKRKTKTGLTLRTRGEKTSGEERYSSRRRQATKSPARETIMGKIVLVFSQGFPLFIHLGHITQSDLPTTSVCD